MAELGFELDDIERLINLVEDRNLDEIIIVDAGVKITIRGTAYARRTRPSKMPEEAVYEVIENQPALHPSRDVAVEETDKLLTIISPMVGVFYRAPGVDATPFVEVGDYVEIGQTIGLMEAMKVFSEIPSDFTGTVVEIIAYNSQLVHPGDPLLRLRPNPV